MAVVVFWFDFICFGIVVAAYTASLWILWTKEGPSTSDETTSFENLLATEADSDGFTPSTNKAPIGSDQLWTSCWRGVHPVWLFLTRFISFVALAGFLSWDLFVWDASIFVYYTEWTFTLVMVYFALGTVISAYGCWVHANGATYETLKREDEENTIANTMTNGEKRIKGSIKLGSHYPEEILHRAAGIWGYLIQIIYQTCGGAVLLTDIVFWCVIVPFLSDSHFGLNTLMVCMHTLNAVFLLLDTALNSLPFPWFRIAYFIQWGCLYCVFQWVIHACGFTWWPYPFLELDTPWAPLWYFGLALVHIPCYGLYTLIFQAKNSVLPRLFPRAFIKSH